MKKLSRISAIVGALVAGTMAIAVVIPNSLGLTPVSWSSTTSSEPGSKPLTRSEFSEQIKNVSLPGYASTISDVTAQRLDSSWRAGCPLAVAKLKLVTVRYVGLDKKSHDGQLVVSAAVAGEMTDIFKSLYEMRFPFAEISTIENYGSDDNTSIRANNTSAFNCRNIAGTNRYSKHSFGAAIDINPLINPYVLDGKAEPVESAPYLDRNLNYAGMLAGTDDPAVRAFTDRGWTWGGTWTDPLDIQHFEKEIPSS